MRFVEIRVEHDDCKRNQEHGILVLKGAFVEIPCIVFPVTLAESGDDPVDLLSLAWQTKSTVGQKMSQAIRCAQNGVDEFNETGRN